LDFLQKHIFQIFTGGVLVAGWLISHGRQRARSDDHERQIGRLITDVQGLSQSCSGVSCAEQRERCREHFVTLEEFREMKAMLSRMSDNREREAAEMRDRWGEMQHFIGEVRTTMAALEKRSDG